MKRRPFSVKTFLALALMLAGSTACSQQAARTEADTPAGDDPILPRVTVGTPSAEPLAVEITAPGSFVAYEEATISNETAGRVAAFRVKGGSRVQRGDVLVRLDKTKAELAVRQVEAALAQARANFERAKAELDRKRILLADRTISQGTFDTFKAQHDDAAAAVQGAESALALAREHLQDMTVVAPFSGVVKEKRASIGEYLGVGKPLLVLIQVDPIKLRFEVPERHAARLPVGQEVHTCVTALPGETFTGKISTIFPALAVQSRTIRVEALIANPQFRLKPGFYASVRVPLSPVPGSLVVPRAALFRREGTESLFVLKGERVQRLPVQVGGDSGDQVEILSGLGPTDRVIISDVDRLRDGEQVQVQDKDKDQNEAQGLSQG